MTNGNDSGHVEAPGLRQSSRHERQQPTSKYTAAVEAIVTPRPNRSDAMPTTVGAANPPRPADRVHQPGRRPAVLGRTTS